VKRPLVVTGIILGLAFLASLGAHLYLQGRGLEQALASLQTDLNEGSRFSPGALREFGQAERTGASVACGEVLEQVRAGRLQPAQLENLLVVLEDAYDDGLLDPPELHRLARELGRLVR
jgi:hypothetical protein